MVETPNREEELRFRNVSLHDRGKEVCGTLYLRQHHVVFSYYPDTKAGNNSTSSGTKASAKDSNVQNGPSVTPQSSTLTEHSALTASARSSTSGSARFSGEVRNSTSTPTTPGANVSHEKRKEERPKQRPKEIWIPYPIINNCVLRPSHSAGHVSRPAGTDSGNHIHVGHDDDEMFPPTFGTASYTRPSSDSARLAPYSSPVRPKSPILDDEDPILPIEGGRQPAIRIRRRDFRMMAFHFHATASGTLPDDVARQVFYMLRSRCCVDRIEDMHAFHFTTMKEEAAANPGDYDARREYSRLGIGGKAAEGPGAAWRITDINHDYSYSATYPKVLCVPRTVSDNMLKYGGAFRSRSRIPCLSYLHSNGGSITRSSQPMVGVQNKRNPQDERLVSAIFSSHTPSLQPLDESILTAQPSSSSEPDTEDRLGSEDVPSGLPISQSDTALDERIDEKAAPIRTKVYGSTRRNLIVDARPKINALANRATGGGIEDVANYTGNGDIPVERIFLNIANIHVMRDSLDKVVKSFANSDYIDMKPNQDTLRKSGWLGHISNMIEGAEMIARVVGLGGSHVLIHCSDGWDRTAQVSALVQVMMDPQCRTLEGFITLVQKEFLSFGHKFRDRNGIEGSEKWFEIENERIAPSRNRENNNSDPGSLNALGAKAFTGAKNWFEKNRGNLFRQQNSSHESVTEQSPSRSSSPPPNPLLHSPPTATGKEEKEHRMSEKEVSPIFHQFLDATYQLQYQNPNCFEFNERFLRRLFYHMYSSQYGEFLFNNEKERAKYKNKVGSVWGHFLFRRQEFVNADYVAKVDDPLLFPRRSGLDREVDVRWWSGLFQRNDEEMNLPLPPTTLGVSAATSTATSFDERGAKWDEKAETLVTPNGSIKETKSTPTLNIMNEGLSTSLSWLNMQPKASETEASKNATVPLPNTNNIDIEPTNKIDDLTPSHSREEAAPAQLRMTQMDFEEGDPLGATTTSWKKSEGSRLDFAAFASQNAFQDR